MMQAANRTACYIALCMCYCACADAYKILLYPNNLGSAYIYYSRFGAALADNHEVHMLVTSNSKFTPSTQPGVKVLRYPVSATEAFAGSKQQADLLFGLIEARQSGVIDWFNSFQKLVVVVTGAFAQDCEDLLMNEQLIGDLLKEKYDLIVLDPVDMECKPTLPYKLGTPTVLLSLPIMHWLYRVPYLPSAVPNFAQHSTDVMSFAERFKKFLYIVVTPILLSGSNKYIEKYVPEKELKAPRDIIRESMLWFYLHETVLQFPSPLMPNTIDIGGLMQREGKPLPMEYQALLNATHQDVVLLSFGSYISYLPEQLELKLCEAFHKIDSNILVIWKRDSEPKCNVPPNVLTKSWVPQNDLLAHEKVKLFITHCGWNSYIEAGYHGTPMIGFPFITDQMHNAATMESKGLGVEMDIATFTAHELANNINLIINNSTYRENAKRLATILRHQDVPANEKILFWIEHVLKFGDQHLRSGGYKLNDYEFLMLDILAVILLGFVVLCALAVMGFCCLFKAVKYCCCKKTEHVKKKTE